MELLFLGTGAGMPFKERNTSALAMKPFSGNSDIWLFDCGEATQHQILHSPVKPGKIKKIWITHLHGDHIFGLPGLIGSRSFMQAEEELEIYGPEGIEAYIHASLEISGTYLSYPLTVNTIKDGSRFDFAEGSVMVRKLNHTIPSFGFRMEAKSGAPKLKAELLKKKGIEPGPVYRELKNGCDVTLKTGEVLKSAEYLHPPAAGISAAILGDTSPCDAAVELARNADVLVHEATFAADLAQHAANFGHSTSVQAAKTASEACVKKLILTHVSARYPKEKSDVILEEARTVFTNTFLAHDFSTFSISSP